MQGQDAGAQPRKEKTRGEMTLEERVTVGMGCWRRKEWYSVVDYLSPLLEMEPSLAPKIPSRAWSCLGLALVRTKGASPMAMQLCQSALLVDPDDPVSLLNHAWCLLLARRRKAAVTALLRGRKLHPDHAGLRDLHETLGVRDPPVLSFLARGNGLNRWLGAQRFALRCRRAARS